ncbi:Major facilitator superfamily domain, general substrate transporter [Penicillium digitatum]|uniref:Major facilitator superfamily domain, general substrate transporter n=1 Tax=Penicillium digitatum TaxID=36651 RepID=A0A7T7BK76_PENDI|nr:Major facilitator superfamily domain, general substrate transporter [Penicillium digitatum]
MSVSSTQSLMSDSFCTSLHLVRVFITSLSTRERRLLPRSGCLPGLGSDLQFCLVMGLVAIYFSEMRVLLVPSIGFGWTFEVVASNTPLRLSPREADALIGRVAFRVRLKYGPLNTINPLILAV